MAAKKATNVDIRDTLPEAIKGGTASKPVWTIGTECFEFKASLKKTGRDKDGHKPALGSRTLLAKYNAGQTTKGAPLMFVGVFRKVDGVAPAPVAEGEAAPVETPVEGAPVDATAEVTA